MAERRTVNNRGESLEQLRIEKLEAERKAEARRRALAAIDAKIDAEALTQLNAMEERDVVNEVTAGGVTFDNVVI